MGSESSKLEDIKTNSFCSDLFLGKCKHYHQLLKYQTIEVSDHVKWVVQSQD